MITKKEEKELLEQFRKMDAESEPYTGGPISSDETQGMTVKRKVPLKRGNYWVLPKSLGKKSER